MVEVPEPAVRTTKYLVSCLPENVGEAHMFTLVVEYRGNGRWAVVQKGSCYLGADGKWSWGYRWPEAGREREPVTDEEMDDYHRVREAWLETHRFDEETAIALAREHAPLMRIRGYTVADALADHMKEQTDG